MTGWIDGGMNDDGMDDRRMMDDNGLDDDKIICTLYDQFLLKKKTGCRWLE